MVVSTKNKGKYKQKAKSDPPENYRQQSQSIQSPNYYEVFQPPTTTNITKGHDMPKQDHSIRISSVNMCGITTKTFEQALLQAQRMQTDMSAKLFLFLKTLKFPPYYCNIY